MRVLVFSDIHADKKALERLLATPADVYICAGDLVNWARGLPEFGEMLGPLGEKVWMMPGNHESAGQIAKLCAQQGLRNFHEQVFELDGTQFAGLGYSNPTPFNTPGEYSEEELAERLARFEGLQPLVLVCHAPPKDTPLDQAGEGKHFGSSAVREFIEKQQPRHFFCGHIHEAAGRTAQLGGTHAMNVGKQGYLLEL